MWVDLVDSGRAVPVWDGQCHALNSGIKSHPKPMPVATAACRNMTHVSCGGYQPGGRKHGGPEDVHHDRA